MTSLDSIADTYFTCEEAPIWLPTLLDSKMIAVCNSCTLRINVPTHTVGVIRPDPMGITIEETTLAVLSVNGIEHNLIWTYLTLPGAHRLGGQDSVAEAELFALFRHPQRPDRLVYLCLPVNTGGDIRTNEYFSTLGKAVTGKRPALSALINPGASFLLYTAADIRGRTGTASRPTALCDPVKTKADYYVCETPIKIAAVDLARLRTLAGNELAGPPIPKTEIIPARALSLCQRIRGIVVEGPGSSGTGRSSGYATNAMKCYRLDKEKDIVENRVYVGGKGKPGTVLIDELTQAAVDFDASPTSNDASIQPGDVEGWLGIALGIIIGLSVILGGIVYFVKYRMNIGARAADIAAATAGAASGGAAV